MDIANFLFGPYALFLQTADKIFFYDSLGALLLAVIITLTIYFKKLNLVAKDLLLRFRNLGLFYGILGLLWTGFRHENALYLSWRLWPVLLALVAIVWLVKIFVYWARQYPKDMQAYREEQLKQKYLKR